MKPAVAISAVRAVRPSSSALVATVMPWAKRSTCAGSRAGPREHQGDRLEHADGLLGGRGGDLGGVDGGVLADEHRVGEGPADVDPQEHRRETT